MGGIRKLKRSMAKHVINKVNLKSNRKYKNDTGGDPMSGTKIAYEQLFKREDD